MKCQFVHLKINKSILLSFISSEEILVPHLQHLMQSWQCIKKKSSTHSDVTFVYLMFCTQTARGGENEGGWEGERRKHWEKYFRLWVIPSAIPLHLMSICHKMRESETGDGNLLLCDSVSVIPVCL